MIDSIQGTLVPFLRKNNYYQDESELMIQMTSHPYFPSIRSVTDTFDHFGVEHLAARVPKEALGELPPLFLAVLGEEQSGKLVMVEKNNQALWVSSGKRTRIDEESFLKKWSGVIIAAEKNKKSIKNEKSLSKYLLLSFLVAVLGSLFFSMPGINQIVYGTATAIAACISVLIVREELGFHSALTARICNAGSNTSCQAVFNSKGATLWKNLKLSDISLVYFAAVSFTSLFLKFDHFLYLLLSALNLPVVIYSIWYQWNVVKKWCFLCLSISAISLFTFGWLSTRFVAFTFSVEAIVYLLAAGSFVAAMWYFLKPLLVTKKEYYSAQSGLLKFKRDITLFEASLMQGTPLAMNDEQPFQLIFGNIDAPLQITAVTNPLCGFCVAAFANYRKMLSQYDGRLSLNLKFNVSTVDKDSQAFQIANSVHNIYHEQGPMACLDALDDWFQNQDMKRWKERWPVTQGRDFAEIIESQRRWCLQIEINFTPATIFADRLYPKTYNLEDGLYLLEELLSRIEVQGVPENIPAISLVQEV